MTTSDKLRKIIARSLMSHGGYPREGAVELAIKVERDINIEVSLEEESPLEIGRVLPPAPENGRIPVSPSVLVDPSDRQAAPAPGPSLVVVPSRQETDTISRTGKMPIQPDDLVFSLPPETIDTIEKEALAQARAMGPHVEPDPEFWGMPDIISILTNNTPSRIKLTPYGVQAEIELERNIQAMVMMKGVKLTYSHPKIQSGTLSGGKYDRMSVGLSASVDFYQHQKSINITEAMRNVTEQARKVFGQRQRDVVSSTPRKVGEYLTYNERDNLHTETDKQPYKGGLI